MRPEPRVRWTLPIGMAVFLLVGSSFPVQHAFAEQGSLRGLRRGGGPLHAGDGNQRNGYFPAESDSFPGKGEEILLARAGEVTPEKLERWRTMTPAERDRVRKRYRRWKQLPPEKRERIIERRRKWRELPEGQRRFLKERREIYREAWPQEKRAIESFFRRWRQLPPERRHALRGRIAEWRDLPESERDERLMEWPFYRKLPPDDRKAVSRFLFSNPPPGPGAGPRDPRSPRD